MTHHHPCPSSIEEEGFFGASRDTVTGPLTASLNGRLSEGCDPARMGQTAYIGTFVLEGMEDHEGDLASHPLGLLGARMTRFLASALMRQGWHASPVRPQHWGWVCDVSLTIDGKKACDITLGVSPESQEPFEPSSHDGVWLVQLHLVAPGVFPKTRAARAVVFNACWEDLKGALEYARAGEVMWETAVAA